MPTYRNLAVNWGVNSTLNTVSWSMQSRDHGYKSESETIKDGQGATVAKVFFDPSEEVTFTGVVVAALSSSGSAPVVIPVIGSLASITDVSYPNITGSTWIVEDVNTKGSNTEALKVTAKATRYPGITT
jgi:hypothetical protein